MDRLRKAFIVIAKGLALVITLPLWLPLVLVIWGLVAFQWAIGE